MIFSNKHQGGLMMTYDSWRKQEYEHAMDVYVNEHTMDAYIDRG